MVNPHQIGTSAAIVNGIMFIVGGLMIQAPGSRVITGMEEGIKRGTMEMAAYAGLPLVIVLGVSIILAFILKESYPKDLPAFKHLFWKSLPKLPEFQNAPFEEKNHRALNSSTSKPCSSKNFNDLDNEETLHER